MSFQSPLLLFFSFWNWGKKTTTKQIPIHNLETPPYCLLRSSPLQSSKPTLKPIIPLFQALVKLLFYCELKALTYCHLYHFCFTICHIQLTWDSTCHWQKLPSEDDNSGLGKMTHRPNGPEFWILHMKKKVRHAQGSFLDYNNSTIQGND